MLAGVDEVGRGPLAGPVVAAAVILDPRQPIEGLKDSKKLSEKQRERLYDVIITRAKSYAIASASVDEIDEINILKASLLAMTRAVNALSVKPQHVLVDGNQIPTQLTAEYEMEAIIKGDQLNASIQAASILAKVNRDRYMIEQDRCYPGYGFASHKGYGTKAHLLALDELGLTPLHRRSFAPIQQRQALMMP